jgi:hypothetical protein
VWPPSFHLVRAYLDQLERSSGLAMDQIASARQVLDEAEGASSSDRREALMTLSEELDGQANGAGDAAKVRTLASAVQELATATM